MYTLPQEIEVWYVIPAIRRELSKCMVQNFSMSYDKVGKVLGITKPAVSQYIKEKRAGKIKLPSEALNEICGSCKKITSGKSDAVSEITRILAFIRKNNLAIEVCDQSARDAITNCREIRIAE